MNTLALALKASLKEILDNYLRIKKPKSDKCRVWICESFDERGELVGYKIVTSERQLKAWHEDNSYYSGGSWQVTKWVGTWEIGDTYNCPGGCGPLEPVWRKYESIS